MQLKDYTRQLSLNPNNIVGKRLLGEIRLTDNRGNVIVKARFKSVSQRKTITENYKLLYANKLDAGEWHLSYLLD